MWGAFVGLIKALLGVFLQPRASRAEVQAQTVGETTTALKVEVKANADVQKAADAADAVRRATDSNSGLRRYVATDPNNRDNQ